MNPKISIIDSTSVEIQYNDSFTDESRGSDESRNEREDFSSRMNSEWNQYFESIKPMVLLNQEYYYNWMKKDIFEDSWSKGVSSNGKRTIGLKHCGSYPGYFVRHYTYKPSCCYWLGDYEYGNYARQVLFFEGTFWNKDYPNGVIPKGKTRIYLDYNTHTFSVRKVTKRK